MMVFRCPVFLVLANLEIKYGLVLFSHGIVNHAGFDDAKKNLLDNGCHHQKRGRM